MELKKVIKDRVNSNDIEALFGTGQANKYLYLDKEKSVNRFNEYVRLSNQSKNEAINSFDYTVFNEVMNHIIFLGSQYSLYATKSIGFTLTSEFYEHLELKKTKTKYSLEYSPAVNMKMYGNKKLKSSRVEIGFSYGHTKDGIVPFGFLKIPFSSADKRHFIISLVKGQILIIDIPKSSGYEPENNIHNHSYTDLKVFYDMIQDKILNIMFNNLPKSLIKEAKLKKATFKLMPPEQIREYTLLSEMIQC